jgi:2-amino-4-hydroxy-6-hydroxymethyldihydropteridine diphosphokinase
MSPATSCYAIALGSNRRHGRHGAPTGVLRAALAALAELGVIGAVSRIRATPAMGGAGRGFANAVAMLESPLAPDEMLAELKRLERGFGRRPGRRWAPRVLDLDIILWSEGAWGGPGPTIPHPEYRDRDFVLGPLAEVAPGWRDPMSGRNVRQLRARLAKPTPIAARH